MRPIFTVTREGAVSSSLTVNYTTANSKTNKATAESDYTSLSGILSFSPYETTKTITVPTLRDRLLEGGETFFVKLTDPSNANIADGRGLGTINESNSSYFLTEPDTWAGAQAQAQAAGGNLVTVNDLEEHQLLLDTFGSSQSFWIGLTDQNQEGVFRWINGEPVTFTNWVLAEPNGGNGENYVAMNEHIAGGWNDLSGNQFIRGIVEINNIL